VYVPELSVDLQSEADRLRTILATQGNVNIFLSEGAGVDAIVEEMIANGEEVPRDAFGHVKIDLINPGNWFGKQFGPMIGAEKVLVQKSGYFARSARANETDLKLIRDCVEVAVDSALAGVSGLVGHDEDRSRELRAIEFERIKGGKSFSVKANPWFEELLSEIGQPLGQSIIH
jgi:pyrophosphate--fructose-6-phosphate 1-phosphotransferase